VAGRYGVLVARYIALLRGVNVGSSRRVSMQDLRAVLAGLGYTDVATLLQSGNAVFTSPRRQADKVCAELDRGISEQLGMKVRCVVRTAAELAAVVADNPFPEHAGDGAKLMVSFVSGPVEASIVDGDDAARFAPDEFRLGGREIYLWLPNGASGSRIPVDFWDKKTGLLSTTRNWNTVTKLLTMASSG
jgi:uncharacterized protein (DUF1697 family)